MVDREGLTDAQRVRILRHLVARAIQQIDKGHKRQALDSLRLAFHATANPKGPDLRNDRERPA